MKLTATGTLGGQGMTLDVSGQSMNVSATGPLEIKGGMIMLNPGGGSAGSLPPSSVSAGSADSASPKDEVREQEGGGGAGGGAPGGSAGAREDAADEHLPDTGDEDLQAVVAASASVSGITPGVPVEVSAVVDGAASATFEVLDADTGELIAGGAATVVGGTATAVWAGKELAARPTRPRSR